MAALCPHCGSSIAPAPDDLIDLIRCGDQELEILKMLVGQQPVDMEHMIDRLLLGGSRAERPDVLVRTHLQRMREKLRHFGYDVVNVKRAGGRGRRGLSHYQLSAL
jgi:hypothetical protein